MRKHTEGDVTQDRRQGLSMCECGPPFIEHKEKEAQGHNGQGHRDTKGKGTAGP